MWKVEKMCFRIHIQFEKGELMLYYIKEDIVAMVFPYWQIQEMSVVINFVLENYHSS